VSHNSNGQATIEFALVGIILLVIIIALFLLATKMRDGIFVEHAIESASHAFTKNSGGAISDIILY
jgi:uncharacterized protein (UPF0333 family)